MPRIAGAPGRSSCVSATHTMASAKHCASPAAVVTGPMAPPRMNGTQTTAWLAAAIGPDDPRGLAVEDEGRVHVDVAEDHAVPVDELRAEQDAAHLDRIGRPAGVRHRAHEGFVGEPHVRVHHVEMALVDGQVDRLADRPSGVVDPGRKHRRASRNCGSRRSCRSGGPGRDRPRRESRMRARTPSPARRSAPSVRGCGRAA